MITPETEQPTGLIALLWHRIAYKTGITVDWQPDALDVVAVCKAYGRDLTDFLIDYQRDTSSEYWRQEGDTLWVLTHEAGILVRWCDVKFAVEINLMACYRLFHCESREHHQATLARTQPDVYAALFPDAPVDFDHFDDDGPELADLRESAAIGHTADSVMFIVPPKGGGEGVAQVFVRKNRGGAVGKVLLNWRPQYTRFEDHSFTSEDF